MYRQQIKFSYSYCYSYSCEYSHCTHYWYVLIELCYAFIRLLWVRARMGLSVCVSIRVLHRNGIIVILAKFSTLAVLQMVILTTSIAASYENFNKMKTFPLQCTGVLQKWHMHTDSMSVLRGRTLLLDRYKPSISRMTFDMILQTSVHTLVYDTHHDAFKIIHSAQPRPNDQQTHVGPTLTLSFQRQCDIGPTAADIGTIKQMLINAFINALWATLYQHLTHFPLDKMADISQTIFLIEFSWMNIFVFWLKFNWSFVPKGSVYNNLALV